MKSSWWLAFALTVPLCIPMALGVEALQDRTDFSEDIIELLLMLSKALKSDSGLLSESLPIFFAFILGFTFPQTKTGFSTFVAVTLCVFGYIGFTVLSLQIAGLELFGVLDIGTWVPVALKGKVPPAELADCLEDLTTTLDHMRLLYGVIGAKLLGMHMKLAGTKDTENGAG